MRYLKKFNESEEYYTKLYLGDRDENVVGKSITFNQRDIKLLKEFCDKWDLRNHLFDNRFDIMDHRTTLHDVGVVKSGKYGVANRPLFIMIRKYDDDWYTVFLEGKYEQYKCDQIDGVIKLLEKLFKI